MKELVSLFRLLVLWSVLSLAACAANVEGTSADATASSEDGFVVSSTSPSDGSTDVGRKATVSVTFNEEVDSSTLTLANFSLSQAASSSLVIDEESGDAGDEASLVVAGERRLVSGSLSYGDSSKSALFSPTSSFGSSTRYTITLGTGIKSITGKALTSAYTFSFTTGSSQTTSSGTTSMGGTSSDSGSTTGSTGGTTTSDEETETSSMSPICSSNATTMSKLVCDSSACYFFEYSGNLTTGNICRCDLVTGVRNCFLQDICIPMKMSITASALYYAPSTSCGRSIRSCLLSDTSGTCTPTTLATADFSSFDNGIPNDGTYLYFGDGTDSVDRVLIADGSISTVCQPTGTTNPTNMTIDSSNAYFLYKINDSFVPTALAKCPLGSGTAVTELVTVSNPVIRFVSDGSYLYYVDGGSSYSGIGTDWDLKRVAVSGGSATPLLNDMVLKGGLMGIAVSGDYLYISNSSSSGTAASLLKVKKDGSSFETLADMGNISDIFILGDKVYISGSTSTTSGIFSVTK